MSNVNIWDLLEIYHLEKVLKERLALKTAQLAQEMKSKKYGYIHGPLGREWDKRLKSQGTKELNNLRELVITVREAKAAAMECCESFQCEVDAMVDERIVQYENRFEGFEEKSDSARGSALLYTFLDWFKSIYKPDESEALFRAVKEMKTLNEKATKGI